MNESKLVLFDIGGVLIDYGNVFKTVSTEQKFPLELIDKTFDKYDAEVTTGKITPQELYLKCLTENAITADTNYNFLNSWLRDYKSITPTFELLPLLKQKYQIGLFSNIYKGMIPEMVKMGLLPNIEYDYLFLSCDIGIQKPYKEAYEFIANSTRLVSEQILFVDDKEENLEPARALGWNTFRFATNEPDSSVNKLKELLWKM